MPKQGQHDPSSTSAREQKREKQVAKGGSTRADRPRRGRSGSDSSSGSKGR